MDTVAVVNDPGWRGTWRYGIPIPKFIERRFQSLSPPFALARYRGLVIDGAVIGIVFALLVTGLVAVQGRIRLGEPGSGGLLGVALVLVVGVQTVRASRRAPFDVTSPEAIAQTFWDECSVPLALGLTTCTAAVLSALLTGWWPAALLGAVSWWIAAAVGAPSARRIKRTEIEWRTRGYEGDLLEALVQHTATPQRDVAT